MSRKFNTKKFIKDVLNDRYAHLQTTTKSGVELFILSSFGAIKEMAGSSHTPACYLSKLRSSLEAGKKLLRVWLQYVCGVEEMLLYPSFGIPLVVLWFTIGDLRTTLSRFFVVRNDKLKCKKVWGYFWFHWWKGQRIDLFTNRCYSFKRYCNHFV